MPQMPIERTPDSTVALRRNPYGFIAARCREHGSDLFEARILLQKTVCMTGAEAARLFADHDRFERGGASPELLRKTLFGVGGVQGLDGAAHRLRKQAFMGLMGHEQIAALRGLVEDAWRRSARAWALHDEIVFYDEMLEVLTRAACAWAGVPLFEDEVAQRTRELADMFEGAGAVGLRHWRTRIERDQAERWIQDLVEGVGRGLVQPPRHSALSVFAGCRDSDGKLIDARVAAVEVLNILRPTVAVAVYIAFVAHALHEYPECGERIRAGEEGYTAMFVQEVRRFYPFFPAIVARVRRDFEWRGYHFPRGRRVILDLYGTNHDPRTWVEPDEFRPDRFRSWDRSPFNFVPQGIGDHSANHRCPGEWITIELMKLAAEILAGRMHYELPAQDLTIDCQRLPALPRSRVRMRSVQFEA